MNSWGEKDFLAGLLFFICKDRSFLKQFGSLLRAKDFRPDMGETKEQFIIASVALPFWKKHKVPIGGMLRSSVLDYCDENNIHDKLKTKVLALVDTINKGEAPPSVEAIEEKVLAYLRDKAQKSAIEQILDLKARKKLTTVAFASICKNVIEWDDRGKLKTEDIISEKALASRMTRRKLEINRKRPLLLIDDIDARTQAIGKGDVGIILGPLKKGKSMCLAQLATAYAKQKINCLYLSLEDPKEEWEDRIDASIAYMGIDQLARLPKKLKRRWKRFAKSIMGRIRFVDGTDNKITVSMIDELWEQLRDEGFEAQAVFLDYDKYLEPESKKRDKLEEWNDLYIDLRRFAAKRQLYVWTAAQTKRLGDAVKIISSDKAGEDIGKIQKATMVLGIGQGDSHVDARYLYVTAHKRGRSRFGCEIMTSPEKGLFYDRDRTFRMLKSGSKDKDDE